MEEEVKVNVEENVEETSKVKKDDKKEKKDKHKKEIDALNNKINEINEQLESYKDRYYRAIADLDNQRKQYEKEYRQTLKYAAQDLAEKLIPSFEMFSMVIESKDMLPAEVAPYIQGFDMVYRQMITALESEGVVEISCKIGDKFDHTIHAAMETQEVSDEALVDTITKVIRKGYKIHDRLIKPVTVVVGKAKQEVKESENEESQEQA